MKFKNKQSIYLSPYTPMTNELENYLNDTLNIKIKGYIDSSKNGKNIYKPLDIKKLKIDDIYILSPNWGKDIYNNLSNYINKNKITILKKNNIDYKKSILNIKLIYYIDNLLIKIINKSLEYFNLKIVKLWTNRIGEFCLESEAFLDKIRSDESYKNKRIICVSYTNENDIANKTLYNLYRVVFKKNKNLILLENNSLNRYLQYCINNQLINKKYKLNIEQKSNAYELFTNKKPIIQFTQDDVKKGELLLQKMNLNKPFVCIFARDSYYLEQNFKYFDWSYHDYRDCDIETYNLAIEYLIEKGFAVVRMGSNPSKKSTIKNENFLDYSFSNYQSDFMDIFIISQCEFMIGNTSGLVDVCNAFRIPRIGVNHMPIDHAPYSTSKDIFIPKKLLHKGNYLSLSCYLEMMQQSGLNHWSADSYVKLNIIIENNSPEEILLLVKEYLGHYSYNNEDKINQNLYQKIHLNSYQFKEVKTNIGANFLKNNKWFLQS